VAIGYSLSSPALHLVCAHQYRCIRLALHELTLRGYCRIGLVMLRASDERVDHNWLAGYLIEQHGSPERTWPAPQLQSAWDERSFTSWLRRTKPDAIVTKLPQVLPTLRKLGLAVPDGIGLAYLSDTHPGDEHSGVDENPRQVGAAAVDFVVGMLHRNERGVPDLPHRLLIDGVWIEGETVRPRPSHRAVSTV
jgi:LacI family transcriptional regulator/LacI family repressor for deo operon, udp, cdd, tsx, nupC, and nupG